MRNDTFPLHDPVGTGIFLLMARALAPAPFVPDFDARRVPAEPWPSPPRAEGTLDASAKLDGTSAAARPRKIGFLERLDRWFWAQQQRDVEAYLARSADIHDLEHRMRNLERSAWHRYN